MAIHQLEVKALQLLALVLPFPSAVSQHLLKWDWSLKYDKTYFYIVSFFVVDDAFAFAAFVALEIFFIKKITINVNLVVLN